MATIVRFINLNPTLDDKLGILLTCGSDDGGIDRRAEQSPKPIRSERLPCTVRASASA